ncbi:MAG: D-glycero-beta-D-manno-heptose 1-phosphate adenylyltransferase [Bacteroidales bacterium]|nr:D-glycero-beta-D-manno-heptose 1-phosphate adenylyltransferase [Bacteroidales bacterium]
MTQLEVIENKILTNEGLEQRIAQWKKQNLKIVFTNGCFDLLHLGHVDYLAKAKDLGDRLIIGVNTDASVRRLKGEFRPLQDENSRLHLLAALEVVDAVVLFDEDTPYELIKQVQPDVLVKGADYKPESIVGYDIVTSRGGKVETIEYLEGYSTTSIEQRILKSREQTL